MEVKVIRWRVAATLVAWSTDIVTIRLTCWKTQWATSKTLCPYHLQPAVWRGIWTTKPGLCHAVHYCHLAGGRVSHPTSSIHLPCSSSAVLQPWFSTPYSLGCCFTLNSQYLACLTTLVCETTHLPSSPSPRSTPYLFVALGKDACKCLSVSSIWIHSLYFTITSSATQRTVPFWMTLENSPKRFC